VTPEDDVVGRWTLDEATLTQLRLKRVQEAMDSAGWWDAVLEVEELLDEQPVHAEALFLLGEALLEIPDAIGAEVAYRQHISLAGESVPALVGLAVARFDRCDLEGCLEAADRALALAPDAAEAHYYRSLALEHVPGRASDVLMSFMAAHRLRPQAYPIPATLGEEAWEAAISLAVSSLHPTLRSLWDGIPVALHDLPSLEDLVRGTTPVTPTVTALYVGTPPPEPADPTQPYDGPRPDHLLMYRRNLCRAGSFDAVTEEIARALEAEGLHWLGWSPDDLP
jgi:tetratricopeptide (TPR) repeat protein